MSSIPPVCDFNWPAPDFQLPATDGRMLSRTDISGPKGCLIIFMCNHCPYVLSVLDRIQKDARDLQFIGIGVAAINANDAAPYPADSLEIWSNWPRRTGFHFRIFMMKRKALQKLTARPVHRISSALSPTAGFNIGAG